MSKFQTLWPFGFKDSLKTKVLSTLPDVDSRPWDFQAEECSLRSAVDRFNHRRYQKELPSNQQMQQSQEQQQKSNTAESPAFGQEVKFFRGVIFQLSKVLHSDVKVQLLVQKLKILESWKNNQFL